MLPNGTCLESLITNVRQSVYRSTPSQVANSGLRSPLIVMSTKTRNNTADLFNTPGMKFNIHIDDPKQRIQAYINEYANPINLEGQEEVRGPV